MVGCWTFMYLAYKAKWYHINCLLVSLQFCITWRVRKIFTLSSYSFSIFCVKDIFSLILSFFFFFLSFLLFSSFFSPGMFAHFFPDQTEKDNGKDLQLIIYFVCVCVLGFYVLLTMKVSGLLQVNLQALIILNHSSFRSWNTDEFCTFACKCKQNWFSIL